MMAHTRADPPTEATAHPARPGARKMIIPAIPRALERKPRVPSPSASVSTSSVTGPDHKELVTTPSASDPSSQHALTPQEDVHEAEKVRVVSSPDSATAAANHPTNDGAFNMNTHTMERAISQQSNVGGTMPESQNSGQVPNGVIHSFHAASAVPQAHLDNGIVFGGSRESSGSPPTIPPSARSTYTQPTPLSDSGPQSLPAGRNGSVTAAESIGVHRGSDPPSGHSTVHIRAQSNYSLSSVGSNTEEPVQYGRMPGAFLNPENLHGYLRSQFNNPGLADCILDLDVRNDHMMLWVHSVIIARSSTVRGLLQEYVNHTGETTRRIVLKSSSVFITLNALRDAIRVCYGTPLPSPQRRIKAGPTLGEGDESPMRVFLADLSAGQLLDMFDVSAAAAACIRQILSLSNVEELLAFLLADSPGLTDDSPQSGVHSPPLGATHISGPWTFELINAASNVLLLNMGRHFVFDNTAPPATLLHGFPPVPDMAPLARALHSHPSYPQHTRNSSSGRVFGIQFGDFPSTPDAAATTISSLLLSLPFNLLRHVLLLARPPWAADLVAERERRRCAFLQNLGPDVANGIPARSCWRETFDPVEGDIHREWVGTP